MKEKEEHTSEIITEKKLIHTKCDKYDYMASTFCGAAAGFIDIIFVNTPWKSKLSILTDMAADSLVKKTARLMGWKPKVGKEDNIASAIGFFERRYQVNYDQTHCEEVLNMTTRNHHFKSLSHCPDLIGLFFSILDQFMHTSSFLNNGQLIRIDTSDKESPLKGENFVAKLFSGFCNWLGHIMSDLAGSTGSRGVEKKGRGSGIAIPFMELFQLCDFGMLQIGKDRQNLATVMTRVFQEGYDFRFGAAMAIPVVLEELMIRIFWVVRKRFYEKKTWNECIPSKKYDDLRTMLIVGNTTLCIIDGTDAAIRGIATQNMLTFFLHLNFVAWARLTMLILKELAIRFGPVGKELVKDFMNSVLYTMTEKEKRIVHDFYNRMQELNLSLEAVLREFMYQVENEYKEIERQLMMTTDLSLSSAKRAEHSVELAQVCGVSEDKIIKSNDELDNLFL